jgi:hypothetical protein
MLLGIRSLLLIANTIVQSYRLPILQVTCDICFCLFFAVQVFLAQLHCPELTSKIRSSGPCRCNYTLSWSMDPRFSGRHIPPVFFSAHLFSAPRLSKTAHKLYGAYPRERCASVGSLPIRAAFACGRFVGSNFSSFGR